MNTTLVKALAALVPTPALVALSVITFAKRRSLPSIVQLARAGCLVVVVLTHVAEALQLLPSMQWSEEHSIGHSGSLQPSSRSDPPSARTMPPVAVKVGLA